MSNVIRLNPRIIRRAALEQKQVARYGVTAWAALSKQHRKIPALERERLAKQIEKELGAAGISHAKAADLAGFTDGGKAVYRLTLPEGASPATRRLRAHARDYARLLQAIAQSTGESLQALAHRVCLGTSLHPRFRDGVSEIESLEAKLQEMADELNDRLDLMATFRAIAQARREQFDRGGWKRWPMFDLDPEEYAECEMERLVQAESARLADLSNAYYDPHFEARSFPHLTEVDLFGALEYLPCAFLGFRFDRLEFRARETAADVGSKRGRALEEDFRKSLLAAYAEIDMSDWSSFGPKALNEAELHRGTWLVLYPDRDLQAIVPVLTSCEQEWGATWIPVQAERLLRLRDVEIISHRSASIEERIAESINDNLYELLTSSGKRLRRHPYLASSRHLRSLARRFRAGDSMEESASHE